MEQVLEVTRQHTPNPAAQVPEAAPDLEVHSVEVKHVPVKLEAEVQASLGNWTMEKRPMGLGAGWTSPHNAKQWMVIRIKNHLKR